MSMKSLYLVLVVALALALAAPALAAGPEIQGLMSPTHPDEWTSYYSNDPVFSWDGGPVFEPLGEIGLNSTGGSAAVSGTYAYVPDGGSTNLYAFSVVNVADAANPTLVTTIAGPVGSWVNSVEARGNYLYATLAGASKGLWILDIKNPALPKPLALCPLPDEGRKFTLDGDYAYVADWTAGLQIVSIARPKSPRIVGSYATPPKAEDVTVSGTHAYVCAGGLQIVDVSDPTHPALTGSCPLNDEAGGVALVGTYAYVGCGYGYGEGALYVVDVSDLANPTQVGSWNTYARSVVADGTQLYASGSYSGLFLLDISDPTRPTTLASRWVDGCGEPVLANDSVYAARFWGYPFQVLRLASDISYSFQIDQDSAAEADTTVDTVGDPLHPSASYTDLESGTWFFHVRAFDGTSWGASATRQVIIDRTPTIAWVQSQTHPGGGTHYSNDPVFTWGVGCMPIGSLYFYRVFDVTIHGDLAYVAADWDGLKIVDVSDPAVPKLVGSCPLGNARAVTIAGTYAYVVGRDANFRVVDISTPSAPEVVASLWTGEAHDVVISGDLAYVATRYEGLKVLSVQDPLQPADVAVCGLPEYAHAVVLDGGYAYVADGWAGLQIVSLQGESAYTVVGSLHLGSQSRGIDYADGKVYVADRYGDLAIVDVGDPTSPVRVGTFRTANEPQDVVVDGAYAYVADRWCGVQVVDVSDPASPRMAAAMDTPGEARALDVVGGKVYVADQYAGLQIISPLDSGCSFSYELQSLWTEPDEVAETSTPTASFTNVADGDFTFVVRAVNAEGTWGPSSSMWIGVDHRPHLRYLSSTTHSWGYWSANNDPQFVWEADVPCAEYSYTLDHEYGSDPDTVADGATDPASPSLTLTDVPDGEWYFHLRVCDDEGNWSTTATYLVSIKTRGPWTEALAYTQRSRTAPVTLQYAVHDITTSYNANVTIEIRTAAGVWLHDMACGWKPIDVVCSTPLDTTLKRGKYIFIVHATDWLGNPEYLAGRGTFQVL